MLTADFYYNFPEHLVATKPHENFRTMWLGANDSLPSEIAKNELLLRLNPGDVLAINDTRVLRRRVTALNGLEILFLKQISANNWEVLCPASKLRNGEEFCLPNDINARLEARGLPQKLWVSKPFDENYFVKHGELALPPYIQKARGNRKNYPEEEKWYQTAWAEKLGSQAAPTASLHFTNSDLDFLRGRGVQIAPLTLHVGMGTFLPIKSKSLEEHHMHNESTQVPLSTIKIISHAKSKNKKVWALGTTVTRALESWGHGLLREDANRDFIGDTELFIRPGFRFEVVDGLFTNFHQPCSTLLALVSAFAGRDRVISSYEWAISQNFRLFSYGDLTAWTR
ncbi:MAG: hypothetical protein A2Z20_04760 [Bdellovibrionales bacterium RBG_16_40_8]|nr:MAG: hypothetical protein A2Z20_04760 [Bdellovibrionales bacterium RBG_16_40_8]